MSASSRPVPKGYGGSARMARRQGKRMESKQDKGANKFDDARGGNADTGAQTVPGYYNPPNEKYLYHHPREQHTAGIGGHQADLTDMATDPHGEEFEGFKRDLKASDIKRWEKRREIKLQEAYDHWIARRFDISDPHVARWLRKIEPEFWERRKAFMEDKMNIEAFLTRMRLYGPQTIEDLEGIYALHTDAGIANGEVRPIQNTGIAPSVTVPSYPCYTEGRFAVGPQLLPADMSANTSYMSARTF